MTVLEYDIARSIVEEKRIATAGHLDPMANIRTGFFPLQGGQVVIDRNALGESLHFRPA